MAVDGRTALGPRALTSTHQVSDKLEDPESWGGGGGRVCWWGGAADSGLGKRQVRWVRLQTALAQLNEKRLEWECTTCNIQSASTFARMFSLFLYSTASAICTSSTKVSP